MNKTFALLLTIGSIATAIAPAFAFVPSPTGGEMDIDCAKTPWNSRCEGSQMILPGDEKGDEKDENLTSVPGGEIIAYPFPHFPPSLPPDDDDPDSPKIPGGAPHKEANKRSRPSKSPGQNTRGGKSLAFVAVETSNDLRCPPNC